MAACERGDRLRKGSVALGKLALAGPREAGGRKTYKIMLSFALGWRGAHGTARKAEPRERRWGRKSGADVPSRGTPAVVSVSSLGGEYSEDVRRSERS